MSIRSILSLTLALIAGFQTLCAQGDTCFVAIRIENEVEPYVALPDTEGNATGVIAYGLNGDIYLYTNKPFIKVVNQSTSRLRNDRGKGDYRVLFFDCGHATTYDYVRQKKAAPIFQPKKVNNFQNSIYFGGDLQQSQMWIQLENNSSYRRHLQIRQMGGEFGGLDKIVLTVAREGKADTLVTYADTHRNDSLVLYPGETVKKVSVTRFSNGMLNSISYNDQKLAGQYTFRHSNLVTETDRMAARSATLTTIDSTLSITAPGIVSLEYSYLEGDGNAQVEVKNIDLKVGVIPVEEASKAWIWWLLGILVVGGVGGYYYRRYQLKKMGIIPETDAEKIARLSKEVATHEGTIKNLREVESGLLSDKDNLQQEVLSLNKSLEISRSETLEKANESDNYHDQLVRLQQHTDEVQENLDEAKRQIAVYESGEVQREVRRLNDFIVDLKKEHKEALAEQDAKNQEEKRVAIEAITQEKETAVATALEEKETAIAAATQEKETAIATALEEKESAISAAEQEKRDAIYAATQEKEAAIAAAELAKNQAIDAAVMEKEEAIAAAEEEKRTTIETAEQDKAQAIATALEEKEAAIAAAEEEKRTAIETAEQDKAQAIATALEEKEAAIAAAEEEKRTAIETANQEKEEAIATALNEKNFAVELAQYQRDQSLDVIRTTTENLVEDIQHILDSIMLQLTTMQQEVHDSRYENNFTNVVNHMTAKAQDFDRWFKKEILENPESKEWNAAMIREKLHGQLLPLLGNNYTWVSEMIRFNSYCSINRNFKIQFRLSGVPTDYLRIAYAEMVGLYGLVGVTLIVPNLFSDDYNSNLHKLNNIPLINSYFPHDFFDNKPDNHGLIYDVLHPGYAIGGIVKQLPEVCVY